MAIILSGYRLVSGKSILQIIKLINNNIYPKWAGYVPFRFYIEDKDSKYILNFIFQVNR